MHQTSVIWNDTDSEEKPKKYENVLVYIEKIDMTDVGYFNGDCFWLLHRISNAKHKDITKWAYMPKP